MTHIALSILLKCEGGAGAEGAILPYVGHLQLISTLKIGADCNGCSSCEGKFHSEFVDPDLLTVLIPRLASAAFILA